MSIVAAKSFAKKGPTPTSYMLLAMGSTRLPNSLTKVSLTWWN